MLLLRFPRRKNAFRGITEFDIYGLLRERVRVLPQAVRYANPASIPPGLVWCDDPKDPEGDLVAITVAGKARKENRIGWQTSDPNNFQEKLIELRQQILRRRAIDPQYDPEYPFMKDYTSSQLETSDL
jgi:hypothetical protein